MLWLIFRTIIYITLFAFIWYGGSIYVAQELITNLHQQSPYAIFVDKDISQSQFLSSEQNGALAFPFATITDAIKSAQDRNITTIIIAPGIYEEVLDLPENIILSAQYGDVTILKKDPKGHTLQTNNATKILNMVISGANNTIIIPYNTSATFINTTIQNAHDFGVEMGKKTRPATPPGQKPEAVYEILEKTPKEINSIPLVRFSNVTVTKNDNQGLYLRDGRVEIVNSKVIENGEEGIDLHPHMFVTISDTDASFNGESGLETEIYDNIVTITDSTFTNNIKNGVAFLTSVGTGDVTLTNTVNTHNAQFGMRCAVHKNKPSYPSPFFTSVIHWKEGNNIFENNFDRDIATECYTF